MISFSSGPEFKWVPFGSLTYLQPTAFSDIDICQGLVPPHAHGINDWMAIVAVQLTEQPGISQGLSLSTRRPIPPTYRVVCLCC